MQIQELTAAECVDVLNRNELGRLACARFDQPYVVPIFFSHDAERSSLYALSMVGQKVQWMRENPKVCLEVEDIKDKTHWTTILVFGRYQELERTPAHKEARARAEHAFLRRHESWLPAAAHVPSREHEHMVVYSILINRLTGRRASRDQR